MSKHSVTHSPVSQRSDSHYLMSPYDQKSQWRLKLLRRSCLIKTGRGKKKSHNFILHGRSSAVTSAAFRRWPLPPIIPLGGSAGIRLDFLPPYRMLVLGMQDESDTPRLQTVAGVTQSCQKEKEQLLLLFSVENKNDVWQQIWLDDDVTEMTWIYICILCRYVNKCSWLLGLNIQLFAVKRMIVVLMRGNEEDLTADVYSLESLTSLCSFVFQRKDF